MCKVYLLSHIIILTTAFVNNKIAITLDADNIFQRKLINETIVISTN